VLLRSAELEQPQAEGVSWPESSYIPATKNETTNVEPWLEQWQILDVAYHVEWSQHVQQGLRHQQGGGAPNSQAAIVVAYHG
jgi:hypothetical protein